MMKTFNKICLMAGVLLSAFIGGSSAQAQNTRLKVVTFNVRSFEPDFDVTPYAKLLSAVKPDIICLNEVENRSSRQQIDGKYRDVVQDLANKLGMFGLFGYSYNLSNKDGRNPEANYTYSHNELYGNAVLSKYPILNSVAAQLPRPKGSADQRGVLTADILLPSGEVIRVAATHLDHVGGQEEQAKVLVSDKVFSAKYPTLLAGDMNEWVESPTIRTILTKYDRLDDDKGTYGGHTKIDYIFGAKGKWKLISTRTIPSRFQGKELSDHWALFSEVELLK